jgi:hypothetical protein
VETVIIFASRAEKFALWEFSAHAAPVTPALSSMNQRVMA